MRHEKNPSLSKINTNPFKRPFSHHVSAREEQTHGSGPGKVGVPGTTADLLLKHLGSGSSVGSKKDRIGGVEKKQGKATAKTAETIEEGDPK